MWRNPFVSRTNCSRDPTPGVEGCLQDGCWKWPLWYCGVAIVGTIALFYPTAWSIVSIWAESGNYSVGFLIIPIVAWLVWDKRQQLLVLVPRPDYRMLLLAFPVGFAWLTGYLSDISIVQQYAFVALLGIAQWTVLGSGVGSALAFPLGFLFLAVPIGEGLVPRLMEFTADFTVGMLQLSGLVVYREGLVFLVPSGAWKVTEECSGFRYLIASFAAGVLYAYVTYQRIWKRLLFILLAMVVPIVANGLRAYAIVMIAHLSDMKLAIGIDHFIYGWVFFGVVIFLLYYLGSFWADPQDREEPQSQLSCHEAAPAGVSWTTPLAVLAVAGIWPVAALVLE